MLNPRTLDEAVDVDAHISDRQFARKLNALDGERDLYKHIATLGTGSIVVMATFLEKLFAHPVWRPLVGVAFGSFIVSVAGCVMMQTFSVLHTDAELSLGLRMPTKSVGWLVIAAGFGGFFVGLIALAAFATRNLLL